ncbi:MAG: tetratricopeptide repeat protein [Candidatus Thorarchaeota archaeon]
MYKHYESSEDVFVDREDQIQWMNQALKRCKKKSVVLHLKGIGGIGKSSLLSHWVSTHEKTIRLDCKQYSEFYQRLNILAKGAVLQGVKLERFDILWQIRQRFVEGVEPVKEEGREWAKEVIMAIPFIGSLASIGSAISAVGSKVTPKLKGKYSTVGKWLQETLGKNYIEKLLEMLWKDPRRAEFLYLEAFLEDINNRANSITPLLFLLDNFEYVDDTRAQWQYQRKKINETQLWTIFLCNLTNCVGVLASRRPVVDTTLVNVEESELTELDRESCIELLNLRNITDSEIQERIISVSGGNPFVLGTLCDMADSSSLSLASIESLRADTLEEVRLKTWRRLFNEVEDLQELVNRAGLLPYFDRNVMNTIAPTINTDQWRRMVHLSFTKDRGNGTYVIHELAKDLVVAELGDRFRLLADEVADFLEKASDEQENMKLLGLAISIQGLHSPETAIERVLDIADILSWRGQFSSALELLDSISLANIREQMIISSLKAHHLWASDRVAEAEHILKEVIDVFEELADADPERNRIYLGQCFVTYGRLLRRLRQPIEAESMFKKALQIARETDPVILWKNPFLFFIYISYAEFLKDMYRLHESEHLLRTALNHIEQQSKTGMVSSYWVLAQNSLAEVLFLAGTMNDAEEICRGTLETKTELINELNALGLLGVIQRLTSRSQASEDSFRRGLDIAREWYEEVNFLFPILIYLRRYGLALRFVGDFIGAETHYKEALQKSRESTTEKPEVYLPKLSKVLNNIAVLYYETGQYSKARESYEEALENFETLTQDWPVLYEKYLAWTLNNYSILLLEIHEGAKAHKILYRALEISREQVRKYPESIFHTHLLGAVLNNLGVLHRNKNEIDKAEESLREALEVRQQLTMKTPDVFLSHAASTLNNLGVVLSVANRIPDAQNAFLKGLEIRRELFKKSSEMHSGSLGFALNNLGNMYKLSDQHSEAEKSYQEALDILENLTKKAPSVYQRYLTMILSNLLLYYTQKGETKKADSARKRLEEFESSDISNHEIWIEEEYTEADVLGDSL